MDKTITKSKAGLSQKDYQEMDGGIKKKRLRKCPDCSLYFDIRDLRNHKEEIHEGFFWICPNKPRGCLSAPIKSRSRQRRHEKVCKKSKRFRTDSLEDSSSPSSCNNAISSDLFMKMQQGLTAAQTTIYGLRQALEAEIARNGQLSLLVTCKERTEAAITALQEERYARWLTERELVELRNRFYNSNNNNNKNTDNDNDRNKNNDNSSDSANNSNTTNNDNVDLCVD